MEITSSRGSEGMKSVCCIVFSSARLVVTRLNKIFFFKRKKRYFPRP